MGDTMITDAEAREKALKIGLEDFSLDKFRTFASCLSGEELWQLLRERVCEEMSFEQLFHSFVAFSLRDMKDFFSSWIQEASSFLDVILEVFQSILIGAYTVKNTTQSFHLPLRVSTALLLDPKTSWAPQEDSQILMDLKSTYAFSPSPVKVKEEPQEVKTEVVDELSSNEGYSYLEEEDKDYFEEEEATDVPLEDPLFLVNTCPNCEKTFSSIKYLKHQHLARCKGKEPARRIEVTLFRCPKCEKEYRTSCHFNHHVSVCGTPEGEKRNSLYWKGKTACRKCGKVFGSLQEKQEAGHSCSPKERFKCPRCTYSSYYLPKVERHYEAKHAEVQPTFPCPTCGITFNSKANLYLHMKRHEGKKHACSECGKKFFLSSKLKLHLTTHFKNELPCEHCGKVFKNNIYLRRHKNSQHPSDGVRQKFKCPYCPKSFREKKYTKKHVRTKHPGMSTDF